MGNIAETKVNDKEVQQAVDFILKFCSDKDNDLYSCQAV
jgi:hypothetical protein